MAKHEKGSNEMVTLYALRRAPALVQGLVRDLRVRWALEEAGIPYEQRLISPEDQASPAYRELQPFGQVPAVEMDGLTLFESGAIVLHIAERSEALMPGDAGGRERARSWVFAAVNSVEPPIQQLAIADLFFAGEDWVAGQRPFLMAWLAKKLDGLDAWLGGRDYLEGRFTAGDLMMTTVLRILRHTEFVAGRPVLDAYQKRCEARPAFQRALAAQMSAFAADAA